MPSPESDVGARIDVSIVTYNSAGDVEKLVASLAAQTIDARRLRITFLDNHSSDDTTEVLAGLEARTGGVFGGWEVLRNPRNVGFGAAHNRVLRRGDGAFVFLLNPDTELHAECLARLLAVADADDARVAAWEPRQLPYEHPKRYDPVTMEAPWCCGAALMLRREAFADVGGFDARFFMYCEDVDISWRLRHRGWRLRYVPSAHVLHHTYESPGQTKPLQYVQTVLGSLRLRTRHGGWRDVLRGWRVYMQCLLAPPEFVGRPALLRAGLRYVADLPHFARRRTKGVHACFLGLDFAEHRLGAFHEVVPHGELRAPPLVSVLVRTTGRKAQVRRALRTIQNQTYRNVEAVLVEDGPATLGGLVDSFADPRIVYLPLGEHRGRCEAGNAAMGAARGKYLGFLDEDDELFADHVEQLVACLEATDARAAYATAFEVPTEWNDRHEITGESLGEVVFDRPFTYIELAVRNITPICAVLFERTLFQQCGGFDPALDRQEDWNLWLRFATESGRFAHLSKTTSLYRVPLGQGAQADRHDQMVQYLATAADIHQALTLSLTAAQIAADIEILRQDPAEDLGLPPQPPSPPQSRLQRWTRHPLRQLRPATPLSQGSRQKPPLLCRKGNQKTAP